MAGEFFDRLAHVGIAIDADGDLYDSSGFPSKRKLSTGDARRNAFTAGDDKLLLGWVAKAQAQGVRVRPKVFDDLERIAPQHTGGSWRGRWLKLRGTTTPASTPGADPAPASPSDSRRPVAQGGLPAEGSVHSQRDVHDKRMAESPVPSLQDMNDKRTAEGPIHSEQDTPVDWLRYEWWEHTLDPVMLDPALWGSSPADVGDQRETQSLYSVDSPGGTLLQQSSTPAGSEPAGTGATGKGRIGVDTYLADTGVDMADTDPDAADDTGARATGRRRDPDRAAGKDPTQPTYNRAARPSWAIPAVPRYAPVESRVEPGQIRALEWMKLAGKRRFLAQEELLLSRWGVRPSHRGTCVLVPQIWADLDPDALLSGFDHAAYSRLSDTRLNFSMRDHTTSWARAASWFYSMPHSGIELDNFLGSGPFEPREGSHLCHQGYCINPNHITLEEATVNRDREQCQSLAHHLRTQGHAVPAACNKHQPRCLLHLASLAPFEAFHVQLAVVAQARRLEPPPVPACPGHPYPTLECRLPLSFPGSTVALDPCDIAQPLAARRPSSDRLVLYCPFCTAIRPFLSLTGFWGHLRDRHQLVPQQERLAEIVRSGRAWLEDNSVAGASTPGDHALLRLAQQTQAPDFTFEVVRGWKLGRQRPGPLKRRMSGPAEGASPRLA